jgi:lactose/L-arabinose transport system permease protein
MMKLEWKRNKSFYIFIFPYVLFTLAFMLFPLVFSFYISFFDWSGMKGGHWVGFHNYTYLFQDALFLKSLYNTFFIGLIHIPIEICLAILFAVFLNSSWLRMRKLFRAALFLPSVTSLVVVAMVFFILLDKNFGPMNVILDWFGLGPIDWLSSEKWSKISIIMLLLWRWTGYVSIIMLAGLQSIPEQLYEAAKIDGAGEVKSFFLITLPMLKPVILFALVMATIGNFAVFSEPYILTGGGPNNSSLTTGLYLYQQGFAYFHFGTASAIAYVIVLITAIFSMIQFKWLANSSGGRD